MWICGGGGGGGVGLQETEQEFMLLSTEQTTEFPVGSSRVMGLTVCQKGVLGPPGVLEGNPGGQNFGTVRFHVYFIL